MLARPKIDAGRPGVGRSPGLMSSGLIDAALLGERFDGDAGGTHSIAVQSGGGQAGRSSADPGDLAAAKIGDLLHPAVGLRPGHADVDPAGYG